MCNTRKDAAAAAPRPMPRSLRRTSRSSAGNAAAATSSAPASAALPASTSSAADSNSGRAATSSSSKPSASSTSSVASLASLREYLPESPTLYPFSEICSATNNFLAKRLSSSSSSSNSWRCTLRGKDAVVFQRRFRGDPSTLRRRLAATCKIHYSSIVRLLGASLGGEYIYLVYEYINGASLAHCLRNPNNPGFTPLSTWVDRMQVATDIAQGLEYIHHYASIGGGTAPSPAPKVDGGVPRRGPVHNRITSSAVMVTEPQLRAKICHFGASELAGEIPFSDGEAEEGKAESPEISEVSRASPTLRRSASRDARFEGTRGYIAPEVLGGGAVSQKSDVFAFGVVLLELLAGEEPVRYGYNKGTKDYERVSLVETAREAMGAPGEAEAEERERQGRLRRWVDRRLRDSYPAEVAEKALRVALECVGPEAGARPDMMRVAGKLSHWLVQSRNWAEKMRVPADISMSMAPR